MADQSVSPESLEAAERVVEAARKACAEGCDCRTNCNHERLFKPLDEALDAYHSLLRQPDDKEREGGR